MRLRLSRTLTDRPFNEEGVWHFLVRELVPTFRELLRSLTAAPGSFSVGSGSATLDLRKARDWSASAVLSGDLALTLDNGLDGFEGTVLVQQDAAGGHLMTVSAAGRTVLRGFPAIDDNPAASANAITRYRYLFATVADVPYLVFERLELW